MRICPETQKAARHIGWMRRVALVLRLLCGKTKLGIGLFHLRRMGSAEDTIIFHHLLKGHRHEAVHIHAGIQCLIHLVQKGPVRTTGIVMDMSINHITAVADPVPGHHRIVTQGQIMGAVADFQHRLHAFKMVLNPHFFHPYPVVVSHNQVFFAGKLAEVRFRVLAEEHEIAENVDRVICANAAVPVFQQGLVHFFYRAKRTAAVLDDLGMSKVQVSSEINRGQCILSIRTIHRSTLETGYAY